MPVTNAQCPHCGAPVHTDAFFSGMHDLGCGEPLPEEWLEENW